MQGSVLLTPQKCPDSPHFQWAPPGYNLAIQFVALDESLFYNWDLKMAKRKPKQDFAQRIQRHKANKPLRIQPVKGINQE